MWRRLQSLDQQPASSLALQAIEFVCVDNHHRIAAVQRNVLRPIAVRHTHEFAESRLSVLKAPAIARRLRGRHCQRRRFSSHADQNITAQQWRQGLGLHVPDADIREQIVALEATYHSERDALHTRSVQCREAKMKSLSVLSSVSW